MSLDEWRCRGCWILFLGFFLANTGCGVEEYYEHDSEYDASEGYGYGGDAGVAYEDDADVPIWVGVLGQTPIFEREVGDYSVPNLCPQSVVQQDVVNAELLETVSLNGRLSFDLDGPRGRPVEYYWDLLDGPEGSVSAFYEAFFNGAEPTAGGRADDPFTPEALFLPVQEGRHIVSLKVVDERGLDSDECGTSATVIILVD